jgi:hypothetical protein
LISIIIQPTTIDFEFRPYNRIPKDGVIYITFPVGASYDWVWTDTYCKVKTGLTLPSCDIIPASNTIQVKGFSVDYIPNELMIKITMQVRNPSTDFTLTDYFTITTYYN